MDFSVEQLGFRPNSKLSVGLVDIFRELKEFPYTQPVTDDIKKLFFDTVTYFENHTEPKLKKLVLEQTGITIQKVYTRDLYAPNNPNTTGCFALIIRSEGNNKNNWLNDASAIISGGANKKAHISVETADQFNNLLNRFDAEVGRFKATNNVNQAICCDMVIDLSAIVFVEKITHEKLVSLSAEEAAAVIGHELGHVLGTVSYLSYCNYSIEILRDAFGHFTQYASVEEKYKFVNNHLLKKTKDWERDPDNKEVVSMFEKVAGAIHEIPTIDTEYGRTAIHLITQILDMMLRVLILVFYMPAILIVQMLSFRISEIALYDAKVGLPKTADFKAINRQRYELERIADEYVASIGLSSYLANALLKLQNIIIYNTGKDASFIGANNGTAAGYSARSRVLFHFNNFIGGTKYIFDSTVFGAFSAYPPMHQRIGMIAQAQLKQVRSSERNPILLKIAIDEYEKTYLKAHDQSGVEIFRKGTSKLLIILQNIFTILSFGMLNANQRRHIEEMLNDAEAVMNNDLYVSTAKVQLLYLSKK